MSSSRKLDSNDYKVAVKRRKGVPKSTSKDIFYSKSVNGVEDTGLARAINRFETKHKRAVCVDDVVSLFKQLNSDEEPHSRVLLAKEHKEQTNNMYVCLQDHTIEYDENPITVAGEIYFSHYRKKVLVRKKLNQTFDEIIEEHMSLLSREEHASLVARYHVPHAGDYVNSQHEPEDPSGVRCDVSYDDDHTVWKDSFLKITSDLQPLFEVLRRSVANSDIYVDLIEDLIFISYLILHCSDPNVLFGVLISIYKKHSKESLSASLMRLVENICFTRNDETPQGLDFRTCMNKFSMLKHSILFARINDALSLAITLGFLNPINITVKNLKLFTCKGSDIGKDSDDFISYVINLLSYFFDIGYHMFSGNFERMFDMSELARIDEDIIHLNTYIGSVQLGSYTELTNKSVEDYYEKLSSVISALKILVESTRDRTYKTLLQNKLQNVYKLLVTFDQSKPLAGLRESPFSVAVFGASSVGKSTLAKMIMTNVLAFNDKNCSDKHICTIQPTDKFYSTYKADCTGVIIDDLCNTRSDKAVVDPAQLLISIINNIPYYAPKSESNEKGKINVRPNMVVTTSNTENLESHIWSNEPISVVRRMVYHLSIKPKPEYTRNNGLASDLVPESELLLLQQYGIQDLWLIDVRYVKRRIGRCNHEEYNFEPVTHNSKLLIDIDIYELMAFLNEKSKKHFLEQRKFVDAFKENGKRHKNCKVCFYPTVKCKCPLVPDDNVQGGFFSMVDEICTQVGTKSADYVLHTWGKILPGYIESKLLGPTFRLAILMYLRKNYLNLINWVPISVRETEYYKYIHYYAGRHKIIKRGILWATFAAFCSLLKKRNFRATLAISTVAGVMGSRYAYDKLMRELTEAPLHTVVPQIQNYTAMNTIFKAGVSISVAVVALKTFKAFYTAMLSRNKAPVDMFDSPHGNLTPNNREDIDYRDEEKNIWSKTPEKLSRSPITNTMTSEQLLNVIKPNILRIDMQKDAISGISIGCLALKSNVFCCPLHLFKESKNIYGNWLPSNIHPSTKATANLYKLKFIKHDGESGNSFSATIDRNDIVRVGQLDLCVFKVFSGGSFPDISKYCMYDTDSGNTITLKRLRSGKIVRGAAFIESGAASYRVPGSFFGQSIFQIQGGRAMYDVEPNDGDCMMVHIRDITQPSISGFHISGVSGTKRGSYTMFTKSEIDNALSKLENIHQIFTPHAGSILNLTRLGQVIQITDNIPDKAPVNYLDNHNYIIRGSIGDQTSYYTDIKPTFMCSKVEEIFGITNKWSGPKFGPQRWKPWYTYLSSSAMNDTCMDSGILRLSMEDYINPLKDVLLQYNEHEKMRPLTQHEVINGIVGKRFIDHINFSSSIGFPLTGKKSKYMQGDPGNYNFTQPELFEIEFDIMRDKYLKGERYYPVFKACLKDEPKLKTSEKVRVFQAADITLQFGWRKYGLPILRFLSLHPLLSECAVGVNPYNDEWDQLHKHVTFDDEHPDRIVAGDYKHWDQKLPSQLVMAAFEVFIRLAKMIPTYSEEDIMMLQGLATDTTYFLSNFNGTLIEFCNGLPSGHNLTAHINSMANSILLRYGYYIRKNPPPFRRFCRAITYGDDFECGVKPVITKFNHLLYKETVEALGMTLTMPDKTSEAIPFLHVDACDFLKRRSIKCDIDGLTYGALDLDSMCRSLMVHGKTSISPREHAHSVIRGFVHDLSYHDRNTYNNYIYKIRDLLTSINLIIPESNFSYDEYYNYRNNKLDYWEFNNSNEDVINNAATPVGYPMTPEASGASVETSYYVSSSSESSGNECAPESRTSLTNNNLNESYLGTKVLSEDGGRTLHDDCVQAEVFAKTDGYQDNSIVTTGTAVLTSAAEHAVQNLDMKASDILSLRQDPSRDLGNYLSRPIEVYKLYPDGSNQTGRISPLYEFLNTNRIRDKIRNYAYLNAKIHIKAVVVGSPTMAGAYMVSLHPWATRDNGLGAMSFNANTRPDIPQASQLPSFIVDLSRESGGEIAMPIICPSNGLNITRVEQITSVFSLHINTLVPAKLPANTTQRPQISVYVWLTDVALTGTSLIAELPQSDEYNVNPEDKPSSDAITMGQALKNAGVTLIGKATELGIDAAMAAMGLSNPNSQEGITPNVPRLSNNLACYNGPQNIEMLSGDYKNEVPLDSTELGFEDADHMNLNNLLSRWSIVSIFNLTCGVLDPPFGRYVMPVTPLACGWTGDDPVVYTPTPLTMAALPFNRWRGAIKYRFQAVGSAFMKGRIKISHDVQFPTDLSDYDPFDTQVLNSVIWDLATANTIEIMVPWASNLIFKQTGGLRQAIRVPGNDGTLAPDAEANGGLILNQFTVINDAEFDSIGIIVSMCGVPGMAFGDMRAVLAGYTFAGINDTYTGTPQSGTYSDIKTEDIDFVNSTDNTLYLKDGTVIPITFEIWVEHFANRNIFDKVEQDTPQSLVYGEIRNTGILTGETPKSVICVNITGLEDNLSDHDKLAMLCMGEKWYSIRQIIKRYTQNWTRNIVPSSNGVQGYYRIRLPDRPLLKGWQGTASLHAMPNGTPFTYARDSFLSFYSVAFLGYRGSFRHKVHVVNTHTSTSIPASSTTMVTRSSGGYVEERINMNARSVNTTTSQLSASASAIQSMPDARAGAMLGSTAVNPVLEYTTPFVSKGKFVWAQDRFPQVLKNTDDGGYDAPWHQIIVHQNVNANGFATRIDKYIAAGDDFSLFFYLYAPRMVGTQPTSWDQT